MAFEVDGGTARGRIGDAMQERPDVVWQVQNFDGSRTLKEFTRTNSRAPERECKAWVDERNTLHPEYERGQGYRAVPVEVWPDFLGLTAAGARFLNWGLSQLDDSGRSNLETRMLGGEIAPLALAAILFPEPT